MNFSIEPKSRLELKRYGVAVSPRTLHFTASKKIFVHTLFRVNKVAFVHDDVLEVGEQFGMILHTADGGECYPAYLF